MASKPAAHTNASYTNGHDTSGIAPVGWPSNMSPDMQRELLDRSVASYAWSLQLEQAQAEVAEFEATLYAEALEPLKPKDIGAKRAFDRVNLLRDFSLIAIARYCRRHPGTDASLAILLYVIFYADNADGTAKLSIRRLAKIFKRSKQAILDGLERLESINLVRTVTKGDGVTSTYAPVIPKALATLETNIAWFLPALQLSKAEALAGVQAPLTGQASLDGGVQDPLDGDSRCDLDGGVQGSLDEVSKRFTRGVQGHPDDNSTLNSTHNSSQKGAALNGFHPEHVGQVGEAEKKEKDAAAELHKPAKRTRRSVARKPETTIPEDWAPTPKLLAWIKDGWVAKDNQISDEIDNFKDWHGSRGNVMVDWDAALRTWMRKGFHGFPKRQAPAASGEDEARRAYQASLAEKRKRDQGGVQ